MARSVAYREIAGRIRAPASKSSMQRAVACALLATEGESLLSSPSSSADCLAALGVARALGAHVEERAGGLAIRGVRRLPASPAARSLDCGESGLCIRMFSPIAAVFEGQTQLRAQGSLRSRPVGMISAPLIELGAACETAAGLPPVTLRGPLRGGRARVDGRESSQFLTGLLIALPLAGQDSLLEVEGLASRGYVDLTLGTMRAFGVEAQRDAEFTSFRIPGGQSYKPAAFAVEGDWSGAAFLLVAAAIAARGAPLGVEGLDPASAQPDRAILDALRAAGAALELEPGRLAVGRGRLEPFKFDAGDCPDLFPPLVVLAAACGGESRIRGARRLRAKESDRAAALCEEFAALGLVVDVDGDLMVVQGGARLAGGKIDSRGDHRMAMAAAVASLLCDHPVEISGSDCVSKSWPDFFENLASIAR